ANVPYKHNRSHVELAEPIGKRAQKLGGKRLQVSVVVVFKRSIGEDPELKEFLIPGGALVAARCVVINCLGRGKVNLRSFRRGVDPKKSLKLVAHVGDTAIDRRVSP